MRDWLNTGPSPSLGRVVASVAALLLNLSALSAHAGDWREAMLGCVEKSIDTERLACFDEQIQRLTAPAPGESAVDDGSSFGSDSMRDPGVQANARSEPDRMVSTITGLDQRPRGEYVFTLSNGQVWTELSAGRRRYEQGMDVRVERTTLGGYMLSTESGRATRVRRLR